MVIPIYHCHDVKVQSPNRSSIIAKPEMRTDLTLIGDRKDNYNKGNSKNSSNSTKMAPAKRQSPVKFMDTDNVDEGKCRKKYLTAKYGQHQMHIIKRRLSVETWIYTRVQEISKELGINMDAFNIDIDDILNIKEEIERKIFLQKQFNTVYHNVILNEFIKEILAKVERI